MLVPDGWEAGPAQFGADVTLDQFAPPTESATVVVEAVDLETGGTALEEWSEFVRQRDEEAGLTPGAASETSLDGVGALQWDVTVTPEDGELFQMREVVTVRDDIGWRITLNDVSDGFGTSAVVVQRHARLLAVPLTMRVAVVGATGAVGRTMLRILEERGFPADELVPLASERTAGSRAVVPRARSTRSAC